MQMSGNGGPDVTADRWSAVLRWAKDSGIPAKTAQKWKERDSLPSDRAIAFLAHETYRRYGLRKADVLALTGQQT